jgi:hypothetical protein
MKLFLFIIETIFIGIFSAVIYKFIHFLFVFGNVADINNMVWLLLFITGVIKHFLGYILSIQDFFCKHNCGKAKSKIPTLSDYFIEGSFFTIMGNISLFLPNIHSFVLAFITGMLINIFAELFGIHNYYCLHKCISYSK